MATAQVKHVDVVMERAHGDKRLRLLVKDRREYLQSYWARGEIYEYDLFGAGVARKAAAWLYDRVSRRTRHVARQGMLRYVEQHYRGGTFVDVGSCIGNHSLFFSVVCGADLVVSFEPVRELFDHQEEVLALNGVSNVRLVRSALGDAEGTARLQTSDFAKNAGMSRVTSGGAGVEVPLTTLDQALSSIEIVKPLRLVKADVEGYALRFLRGARGVLREHKPDVFVECETTSELAAVEREMRELGLVRNPEFVFNLTPTYLFQPAR